MKTKLFKYILILAGLIMSAGAASAELTARANHDHINIDFFYHGSTVSVRGAADPDADLIIKLSSPDAHDSLKQKGKVAGLLWMNAGTLKFENVPGLYSVYSSKKLDEILDQSEQEKYVIGYPALEKHIELSPVSSDEEKAKWFGEFIKFKENSKLYCQSSGKIETKLNNGRQEYYILTDWPYQATPGEYTATVYAVKNGKVVETAESTVTVEQVGLVKNLSNMASNNGLLYGFISVVSALGAGFGVGLIFGKGGGAH